MCDLQPLGEGGPLGKRVDCVERVGSKSRKVGLEVKSQTPACCVHLAAEVTAIRLFPAVASDVVVVVVVIFYYSENLMW